MGDGCGQFSKMILVSFVAYGPMDLWIEKCRMEWPQNPCIPKK